MRVLFLYLFLLCFLSATSFSQDSTLDSLKGALSTSREDSNKVETLLELSKLYYGSSLENAMTKAIEARDLATKLNYKKGLAYAYKSIGIVYYIQDKYIKAIHAWQSSLEIFKEIRDKVGIANIQNNIGAVYFNQGDDDKALEYYLKSLELSEEIDDTLRILTACINIGAVYENKPNTYKNALEYYQRALPLAEAIHDEHALGVVLANIGSLYYTMGQDSVAMLFLERSVKTLRKSQQDLPAALNTIGRIYLRKGDFQAAINECWKGLQLAEEVSAISLQRAACECLYTSYKAIGNRNKALEYHEQMLVLDDSLQAEETSKKLQQMEFAKQVLADSMAQEEKELKTKIAYEADVRQKKRSRNLFLGGGLLVLLLAVGLYRRNRYIRKSRDEISKEKDRSENLLLNILPAEIAEELKEKGRADARDFDMVSILFTDFKGFTQTSEKLTAQELVGEINTCFEAFDAICGKYGVEKIKTIGDSYMSAGGLPIPDESSAKKTVLTALEMQRFMVDRRSELEQAGRIGFQMRAGIHTGPVVAGIVGIKKFQYDIWGDTVNTASRMESHGDVGKVNISNDTYELIKNDTEFTFEQRGKLEVKGKGEVEMWFVSRNLGEDL